MDKYLVTIRPLGRPPDLLFIETSACSLIEAIQQAVSKHEGEPISARKLEDNADDTTHS